MKAIIRRFLRDESGLTAVEYGVIGVSIGLLVIVSAASIGGKVNGWFVATDNGMP